MFPMWRQDLNHLQKKTTQGVINAVQVSLYPQKYPQIPRDDHSRVPALVSLQREPSVLLLLKTPLSGDFSSSFTGAFMKR